MIQEWQMAPEGIKPRYAPPGSENAKKQGCTCSQLTNNFGYGVNGFKGVYCYNSSCPVHPIKGRDF